MSRPHDALFKRVFSLPQHAIGELRQVLPPQIARHVAWDTLRPLPGSYRDPALRDEHVDLLYSVEIAGGPALLYLLLEHKSTADPWTPFQLLRYAVRILEDFRDKNPKARRLPALLALVVYHGRSGWTRSTDLLDLFDLGDAARADVAPYLPSLRFLLDDLTDESAASLSTRTLSALVRLTRLCLRRIHHGGEVQAELRRLRGAFLAALSAPDTGTALISVLAYIAEVRDLSPGELRKIVLLEIGPEMEQVMTSTYDQLVNKGRVEMLLKLLIKRFGELPDEAVDRVRAAPPGQLERWALRLLDAESLAQVFDGD